MIAFQDITPENWHTVSDFLEYEDREFGDFTAAYSWPLQGKEHFQFAISNGCLIWREGTDEMPSFSLPFGPGDKAEAVVRLRQHCFEHSIKLIWGPLSSDQATLLESGSEGKLFIPVFMPEFWPDYIYEREALAQMNGSHLAGKRWFIHKFEQLGNHCYLPFNAKDALYILNKWVEEKQESGENAINLDYSACKTFILRGGEQINGGILYLNGEPVGFNTGERISQDTIVLTFQKALRNVKGAFAMLVREFARNEANGYRFINLSDTQGDPGLHHAKMEYHPLPRKAKWAVFETDSHNDPSKDITVRSAAEGDAMFIAHCILASKEQYDFISPSEEAEEMTRLCRMDDGPYSFKNARIICFRGIPVGFLGKIDGNPIKIILPQVRKIIQEFISH